MFRTDTCSLSSSILDKNLVAAFAVWAYFDILEIGSCHLLLYPTQHSCRCSSWGWRRTGWGRGGRAGWWYCCWWPSSVYEGGGGRWGGRSRGNFPFEKWGGRRWTRWDGEELTKWTRWIRWTRWTRWPRWYDEEGIRRRRRNGSAVSSIAATWVRVVPRDSALYAPTLALAIKLRNAFPCKIGWISVVISMGWEGTGDVIVLSDFLTYSGLYFVMKRSKKYTIFL